MPKKSKSKETQYQIHNTSKSVLTRVLRAAAPGNPKTSLLLAGGSIRVLRGRPFPVTESKLKLMVAELEAKEQRGFAMVTDLAGNRISLRTLKPVDPKAEEAVKKKEAEEAAAAAAKKAEEKKAAEEAAKEKAAADAAASDPPGGDEGKDASSEQRTPGTDPASGPEQPFVEPEDADGKDASSEETPPGLEGEGADGVSPEAETKPDAATVPEGQGEPGAFEGNEASTTAEGAGPVDSPVPPEEPTDSGSPEGEAETAETPDESQEGASEEPAAEEEGATPEAPEETEEEEESEEPEAPAEENKEEPPAKSPTKSAQQAKKSKKPKKSRNRK